MWKVYLMEFLTAVTISIIWVNILDKHRKENERKGKNN